MIEKFPDHVEIRDILLGSIIGRSILHIWEDNNVEEQFNGLVISFENNKYTVEYDKEDEVIEEVVLTKYEFAADYANNELIFI